MQKNLKTKNSIEKNSSKQKPLEITQLILTVKFTIAISLTFQEV